MIFCPFVVLKKLVPMELDQVQFYTIWLVELKLWSRCVPTSLTIDCRYRHFYIFHNKCQIKWTCVWRQTFQKYAFNLIKPKNFASGLVSLLSHKQVGHFPRILNLSFKWLDVIQAWILWELTHLFNSPTTSSSSSDLVKGASNQLRFKKYVSSFVSMTMNARHDSKQWVEIHVFNVV